MATEIEGIIYEVCVWGGSGWSIGLGSLLRAMSGPNSGKFYRADLQSPGWKIACAVEPSPLEKGMMELGKTMHAQLTREDRAFLKEKHNVIVY